MDNILVFAEIGNSMSVDDAGEIQYALPKVSHLNGLYHPLDSSLDRDCAGKLLFIIFVFM